MYYLTVLDEHEKIQKKTFTKWVQSHLRKATGRVPHLEDLYTDLRDGCVLLKLLEILSGENPVSNVWCILITISVITIELIFVIDIRNYF